MKPVYLECDHCGCEAVESLDGLFNEDMADKCMSCGIAGSVHVDDSDDGDAQADFYYSTEPNDLCERTDCEDCNQIRIKEQERKLADARELLFECLLQFTIVHEPNQRTSECLSIVERLFKYFGLPDPCSLAEIQKKRHEIYGRSK